MYKRIVKNVFSVGGIIMISKVFGLVKQIVLARQFGATQETDIVFFSNGVIDDLSYLVTQALLTAFVPIYIGFGVKNDKDKERFVSNVIGAFLLIAMFAVFLSSWGAPFICRILLPTYTGEAYRQFVKDIRLFAPILLFGVLIAIYNALLKANRKFIQGELIGFYQSVVIIFLSCFLGEKYGINILIISAYVYSIWNVIFFGVSSKKYWSINIENPFKDQNVCRLLKMIIPMIFGYAMVYINQQVDKILASGIEAGALTALGYGAVLIGFITTFISSICTIVYTYITELIVRNEEKAVAEMYLNISIIMITIFLPVSVIIIANATDIVEIVFGRGEFSQKAVLNTSKALVGYGISIVPFIFRELFCRIQYSYCDTKHPMLNNTIGIIINIILSILLCPYYGILGITIASSFSVILSATLNYLASKKHNIYLKVFGVIRYIPLWIGGLIGMAICSAQGKIILQKNGSFIRFSLITMSSMLIYIIFVSPIIYRFLNKKSESVKK